MAYFITCIDKKNSLKKRLSIRSRHLKYLEKFRPYLITAGPLIDENKEIYGSLLVMNFKNFSQVSSFLQNDPYNKDDLFKEIIIKEFKKVF